MLSNTLEHYRWLRRKSYSPIDLLLALPALGRYGVLRLRYRNLRGGPFTVRQGADVQIGPNADVSIGRFVRFLSDFTGRINGTLTMGDNVFFNRGCYLSVQESVIIGNNCMFGEYVSIHDEDHVPAIDSAPVDSRGYVTSPIVIGNNVWLGAKVTVVAGVHIGDNAVIGANAVVTRDIPPNSVAVGIPARVIRGLSVK